MAKQSLREQIKRINELSGKKMLNEYEIQFESQFTTEKVETQIYDIEWFINSPDIDINEPNIDFDTSETKSTVIWELDPDMRNWGIKSMGCVIRNIICNIEWNIVQYEEGTGKETFIKEGIIEFDLTKPEFKDWKLTENMEFSGDGGIYPTDVVISFKQKTVTVS